jgi:hypothetical protein
MPRRRDRILNQSLVTCAHLLLRAILHDRVRLGIWVGDKANGGIGWFGLWSVLNYSQLPAADPYAFFRPGA